MAASLPAVSVTRARAHRSLPSFGLLVALIAGPSCHDATAPNSKVAPVALFTIYSGDGQTGVVGTELAQPIIAQATTSDGTPLPGITVYFVVTQGGGKVFADGVVTNSSGNARDFWTLGPGTGVQKVEVRAVDPPSGEKRSYATFTATATVGPAAIITASAGDGQAVFTRALVPIKPAVLVTDIFGNPVSGVSIAFAVTAGGGSLSGSPVNTDANGIATLGSWRMGRGPGVNKLTATKSGLTGSPVTFTATAKFGLHTVVAGWLHACGLDAANDVYCWGYNSYGELGDGTTIERHAPVRFAGSLPTTIALGYDHTCMRLSTGKVQCLGRNELGQLGDGTNTNSITPVTVSGTQTFTTIAAAGGATCGLTASGDIWCWGDNSSGVFGNGTTTSSNVPVLGASGFAFQRLYRGTTHTCALTGSGSALCWGDNRWGKLGDGTTTNRPAPVLVSGGLTFTSLSVGAYHTCGLVAGGQAYCWGNNTFGQLGNGTSGDAASPVAVSGRISFTQIVTGSNHTCGITATGVAYCWGFNSNGEVGMGAASVANLTIPTLVAGGHAFSSITAGQQYTCGVPVGGGNPFCWGINSFGNLGNGTGQAAALPVEVLTPPIP